MCNMGGNHIDGLFWTEPVFAGLFDDIFEGQNPRYLKKVQDQLICLYIN